MTIWDKGKKTDSRMMEFTSARDRELDQQLLWADIAGTAAHAVMLGKTGIIPEEDAGSTVAALKEMFKETLIGKIEIDREAEDVHSFIESYLEKKTGEAGKRIHTGRSRNDQVMVAMRLYMRRSMLEICTLTDRLFELLLNYGEQYRDMAMPGYTHMQVAMPSSFGLWFSAYAESLADDLKAIQYAYSMANQNPLGSGAGYGSSFPLDREMTTQLLGFAEMNINPVYAQMTRVRAEKAFAVAIASIASTVGRLATDICLYSGENFSFIRIKEEVTTGSSIMPHKQNPDLAEIIRGRCNVLQNLPQDITLLAANLPTGYHRDFQIIKERLLPAVDTIKDCIEMMFLLVSNISVRTGISGDPRYRYMYSVEEVNRLVMKKMPFREAYRKVAAKIRKGEYVPGRAVKHTHTGSTGNPSLDRIDKKYKKLRASIPFSEGEKAIENLMTT